ncbi:hypothetical protein Dsin_015672 [Dipteronia sinensis]|uniref:peroxidase n=1 Tax=Dipteronia sinensis TaxID=43782 RepID=A0AAE0E4S5_9ROSI|nr:hypothetical protein Dsin_015672 [Dipteronia sinensis]
MTAGFVPNEVVLCYDSTTSCETITTPTTAAATLRLFYHDIILNGVDISCLNIVSCIIAVTTHDLFTMAGGPYYNAVLGRKDDRISKASTVDDNLPKPTMPMSQISEIFKKRN